MTNPPLTYSKKLKANILSMGNGNDTTLRKWIHQPSEDTLFQNVETIRKSVFIIQS